MNIRNDYELETLPLELPDEIEKYKMCGDFKHASEAADRWLQRSIPEALKQRIRIEQDFLAKLPQQYPYTPEESIHLFRKAVPDFNASDLERLDQEGLAEWIFLDGKKHYINNVFENVMRVDADLRARAHLDDTPSKESICLKEVLKEMKENGEAGRVFKMHASIRLKDEAFYPGITLKAHLPLPALYSPVEKVQILSHSEGNVTIDPEEALCRTICIEAVLQENRPFFVEYEYTVRSAYVDLWQEPAAFLPEAARWNMPEPTKADVEEQMPHIRFTPYLKVLAQELKGEETDTLAVARRIYDYITGHVNYSYMRAYALIPDIPQYCARNLRGDCGVQALLFITLCRICGIPARWQSGLYTNPVRSGPHDWALFYTKEYGWRPVDPSFGGSARRAGDEPRRRLYFGNIDPFRMTANHAFQHPFSVKKSFMRIDPYDNQRGELESDRCGFTDNEIETAQELISTTIR